MLKSNKEPSLSTRDKNLADLERVTGYQVHTLQQTEGYELLIDHPQDITHVSLGSGKLIAVITGKNPVLKIKFEHIEEIKECSIDDEIKFIDPWSYKLLLRQIRSIANLDKGAIFKKIQGEDPTIKILPPVEIFHPKFGEGVLTHVLPDVDPGVKCCFKIDGVETEKTLLLKFCKLTLHGVDLRLETLPKQTSIQEIPQELEKKLLSRFIGKIVYIPSLISQDFPSQEEGYAEIVGYTPDTHKLKVRNRRGQVQSFHVLPRSSIDEVTLYLLFDPNTGNEVKNAITERDLYSIKISGDGVEKIFSPSSKNEDKPLQAAILSRSVCENALLSARDKIKPEPDSTQGTNKVVWADTPKQPKNGSPIFLHGMRNSDVKNRNSVKSVATSEPKIEGEPLGNKSRPAVVHKVDPSEIPEGFRHHELIVGMKSNEAIMFRIKLLKAMHALAPTEGSEFYTLARLDVPVARTAVFEQNCYNLTKNTLLRHVWIQADAKKGLCWTKKGVEGLQKFISIENQTEERSTLTEGSESESIPEDLEGSSSVEVVSQVLQDMRKRETIQFRIELLMACHNLSPTVAAKFPSLKTLCPDEKYSISFKSNGYVAFKAKLIELKWIVRNGRDFFWTEKGIEELKLFVLKDKNLQNSAIQDVEITGSSEQPMDPHNSSQVNEKETGDFDPDQASSVLSITEKDRIIYGYIGVTFPSPGEKIPSFSELYYNICDGSIFTEDAYSVAMNALHLNGYAEVVGEAGESSLHINDAGIKFLYANLRLILSEFTPKERTRLINLRSIESYNERINFRMMLNTSSGKDFFFSARNNPASVDIHDDSSIVDSSKNKRFLAGLEEFGLSETVFGMKFLTPRGKEFIRTLTQCGYSIEKALQALDEEYPLREDEIIKAQVSLCCFENGLFSNEYVKINSLVFFKDGIKFESFVAGLYSEEIFYLLRVSGFITRTNDDSDIWAFSASGRKFFSELIG